MRTIYVLGTDDAEMRAVEKVIDLAAQEIDVQYTWALDRRGVRVTRDTADNACYPGRPPRARVVTVECDLTHPTGMVVDHEIDHHAPGSPGYDAAPEKFWETASLGQVVADLQRQGWWGGHHLDPALEAELRMIAASDHCLGAAYEGRCPGVKPEWLAQYRASLAARAAGVSPEAVTAARLETARKLQGAPMMSLSGGIEVVDARHLGALPQMLDAAAYHVRKPVIGVRNASLILFNATEREWLAFKVWVSLQDWPKNEALPEGFKGSYRA